MNYKHMFEKVLKRCDDLAYTNSQLESKYAKCKTELWIYRIGLFIVLIGIIILYALMV